MRFFVLALMIVLLPLRGWMGDAMATSMATSNHQQEVAIKTVSTHVNEPDFESLNNSVHQKTDEQNLTQVMQDCTGHASVSSDPSTSANGGHCSSCQVCQVCHSVALSSATLMVDAVFNAFALPQTAPAQFTSAQAALRQKPPIS